jgi:hypothetical protein
MNSFLASICLDVTLAIFWIAYRTSNMWHVEDCVDLERPTQEQANNLETQSYLSVI